MGIFAPDAKVARFLNKLGSLIVLNIMTLICCIPILTAGAALTALFSMTLRLVRNEEGKIISGYGKAFMENFKKATLIWVTALAIGLFMAFDIRLLMTIPGTAYQIYRIVLFILILLEAVVLLHALMLTARFENTIPATLKNASILCAGKPLPAILMLLVMLMPCALYMVSLRFLSLGFLLGISGPAFLISIYFTDLFRPMEGEQE